MLEGTLLELAFDKLVVEVFDESLMKKPFLVDYAINDDGSFPNYATKRSQKELKELLLLLADKQMEPAVYEVIDDFLVDSIGLSKALWRLRSLSLPSKLKEFAVNWQARLNIYLFSRTGKLISEPSK